MPYNLAIFNFVVQFMIFMVIFIIDVSINTTEANSNLMLVFFGSVAVVHIILMFYSKREPQLMQIILAKINMLWRFVPKILRV